MTFPRRIVLSMHDATPFHLERMRKAEAVFRDLGVAKITYLLVPEYHGGYPSDRSDEFIEWCRASRPFGVEWHLHGYHHLESPDIGSGNPADAWKRRFLTAGEGEFLALDREAQRRKLNEGREVFRRCLGSDPDGFVAPAWLFNRELPPLLADMGFRFTEDHRRIHRVDTGASLESPVITWATRTPLRKYGSLIVCPLLARIWSGVPVLRAAVHPFDFDHVSTVAGIRSVLRRIIRDREQSFASDLVFPRRDT